MSANVQILVEKLVRMGAARLMVMVCTVSVVLCAAPVTDRPDITMLYTYSTQICVAGGNTQGYGLAFMSENMDDDVYKEEFKYKDNNGREINTSSDCDFENDRDCREEWRSNEVRPQESGSAALGPVTDERWNSFKIYNTNGLRDNIPPYNIKFNIKNNFYTGISIRSKQDAQIVLCARDKPRSTSCYWIIVDGFTNFAVTAIRKCVRGIPDTYPRDQPECRIHRDNITIPEKLLHESRWTHLLMSRESGNRIRLWQWDLDTGARPLLDYTDKAPLLLSYMYLRSYLAIADWKVHKYEYLNLINNNKIISLGPNFNFAQSSSICVSLYVTMCPKCQLEIRIEREDITQRMIEIIEGDANAPFMTWRNVRLQSGFSTNQQHNYYMYAKLSTTDRSEENTFWAIDDFRKCSDNELRVATVYSDKKLVCQSLKHSNWTFNSKNRMESYEPPICPDQRFIGNNCNITCLSTTGYEKCAYHKICLPIREENNQGACVCAPGYAWANDCKGQCSAGRYGYNCNKCGECNNNKCDIVTGECLDGCKNDYIPPYCKSTFPRLRFAPKIVKIFYTSVIVEFSSISMSGAENMVQFVLLECKYANKQEPWFNCSESFNLSLGLQVNTINLETETSYFIRTIAYTKEGYAYRKWNLPNVEVTTTCKVNRDIQIYANARNATIYFEISPESCSLGSYKIELMHNGETIRTVTVLSSNITLQYLKPYTDYEVLFKNKGFPTYSEHKTFKTQQDAPGEINELQLLYTTDQEIILSWKEPKEKNGEIEKYIVIYELSKPIECYSVQISQRTNITIFPNEISSVKISGLQPYSTYSITVAAVTILQGKEVTLLYNTSMSDIISEEEFSKSISATELTAQSVTIRWPVDCTKLRGPLYYQVLLKCMQDEWCDQIKDITLNTRNSNGGITTHDLTPFTHYQVELRASRSQDGDLTSFSRTTEIFSLSGKPPAVRNFTVYSKSKSSISLRWLDPYPPHGHLEKYNIKYSCYSCRTIEITITSDELVPCNLWNEHFKCYILTNLYKDYTYTISIFAKNVGRQWSPGSQLEAYTAEGNSMAPLNLSRQWENNEITLNWNHPDITNGPITMFIITLIQNGTDIVNQVEIKKYAYNYLISEEKKNYMSKINRTFQYSTSYILTVCAVNTHCGENATLLIDTPPETPELSGEISVDNEKTTNTTVKVNIPGVKANTKSIDSFLYVLVSKIGNNISKRETKEEENSLKQEISKYYETENSWIAIKTELNDNSFYVTIGDGQVTEDDTLKEKIHNRELEPNTDYYVIVVPVNQYRNQKSSKSYLHQFKTTSTIIPPSAGLYALLLLLLLPVVAYFVYRYAFKKETRRTSLMMIPGLRVVRSEDQHDPDVIPLTEAANEPTSAKPKRLAAVPKPAPSSKPEEISVPAEVNPTGTNFFHSRIVLLENMEDYLKEALENGELNEQHSLFPRGQTKPWEYGIIKPNKFKNRYNNLIAYDQSRVKLEKINKDQYSDYINASYIHGYRQEKAYIATQGPKLATVNDFWRMIWQEKTQYVIMLANVVEGGKKKCEKYWPEINSSREYGHIDVYFEKSEVYADYEYRTFDLTCKGEKRKVIQLHFTSWPDHGVPLYPQSLVPFLKKMLTIRQSNAPVVVHCSAGVGRTGTIILSDICLRMAAREKAVDVLRYLHEIREQRANMVDNIDQYKLVHMVLLECLLAPDTNIPCNAELSKSIQKLIEEGGLQIQLNYLQQSSWHDKALNFTSPKEQNPINEPKNRFNEIVPCENQVYISRYPVDDDNSDYINAVPVDGFRFKEQFIATQLPMPDTVKDFWRMVSEKSVKIIVSLNNIPMDDKTCCIFWPSENEEMKPVPNINLRHHKLQSFDYYDIHSIVLDDKSSQESSMIQIVQFKNWQHDSKLPQNEENLVMLWEDTENLSHGNYPMVITCYDGANASGLFIAMSFVIEKIKLEQQCDPCLAVRVIRRNRKQFVTNKVQFEFLYRSAVIYLSMFETYSNFQPVVNKQNE